LIFTALFFIDGDMEIQSNFLEKVYNEEIGLKFDFVSGDFLNINFDYASLPQPSYSKTQTDWDNFSAYTLRLNWIIKE